ncbi:MAG TPA: amino acid permease [Gammaproteobacteria bacterium]|nr:amino acid permease [Gammaproteobacteria bacterium]
MSNSPAPKRALGLWMLTALVAGNMIGSGIFLLPASLASFGSISLIAWVLTALGAICLGLVFAKLGSIMPRVGGPYAYCREGFGNFTGFQIAYNYWIALWVGNAAIAVAAVSYLTVFFPGFKNNGELTLIVSVGLVWLMTIINIIGVRQAGIFQLVTTILKLLPLILIGTFGLLYIHPSYLTQVNTSGQSHFSAITGAATLTLWSFIGLESASVPADDVENPQVTIPKATILGVVITSVVYILSTVAIMGVIPMSQLAKSNSPYADAAQMMFGHTAYYVIAIGAIISCLGALNGWTLLQGQIPLAAARDGLFPKVFAKETRQGTPHVGLIVSSLLITALLISTYGFGLVQQFTLIILIATLASLIPYFFTCLAELMIFIKYKEQFNGKRLTKSVIISILGMLYSFWAIYGSGQQILFYGGLLFFSSVPVYVWMQWNSSRIR